MAKKTAALLPSSETLLNGLGDRLRLARLRRHLSAKQVAERAGMAPMTLRSLERGGAGVTIGAYLAVMQVLGIEKDLDLIGKADPLGRELQDAEFPPTRGVNTKRHRERSATELKIADSANHQSSAEVIPKMISEPDSADDWLSDSRIPNSESLAAMITPIKPSKRKTPAKKAD